MDKQKYIDTIVNSLQKSMEINFNLNGKIRQATIIFRYDKPQPLVLDLFIEEYGKLIGKKVNNKDEYNKCINAIINKLQPDIIANISESWVGSNPKIRPSEDPNAKEYIMLMMETKDKHIVYTNEIERKENQKPTLKGWELFMKDNKDNITGNMADRMGTGKKLNLPLDMIQQEQNIKKENKIEVPIID